MYEPAEDSELLKKVVGKYLKGKKVSKALDMGTGSGIQALSLINFSDYVLAVDIDKESVAHVKKIILEKGISDKMEALVSDLFHDVPSRLVHSFNLIVFNPPYLPKGEDDYEDSELFGGADGIHLTRTFLLQAKEFLAENGVIFFVASSFAKISLLEEAMKKLGYKFEVVDKVHISFEDILIYKAWLDE